MANDLAEAIATDYDDMWGPCSIISTAGPELSTVEHETARRMALELSLAGFNVTEGIGGTGVVAMLENGAVRSS